MTGRTNQLSELSADVWREAAKSMIGSVPDVEMRIDLWECFVIWKSWLMTQKRFDCFQAERLAVRKLLAVIEALPPELRMPRYCPEPRCPCKDDSPRATTRGGG